MAYNRIKYLSKRITIPEKIANSGVSGTGLTLEQWALLAYQRRQMLTGNKGGK